MTRFARTETVSRCLPIIVLVVLLAVVGAATSQTMPDPGTLEQRVEAIEQANRTAPWRESAKLIEALGADRNALTDQLLYRIELVEGRNFALLGDYSSGLALVEAMLKRKIDPELRIRALTLAVNMTTNVADFPRAFVWLQEGLALMEKVETPNPRLLGMASYLYSRVGEERPALDYAEQALDSARKEGTTRDQCLALSDYGIALDDIGHSAHAETIRREQIDACGRAGDPVFVADGYKGVGKSLLAQELYAEALDWLNKSRERFAAAGFVFGELETSTLIAEAILHTQGDLGRASELLNAALPTMATQSAWDNIELIQALLSEIAEREGRPAEALQHLKKSQEARETLERDARARRLSYLQVQFDTQAKEQQISKLESERQRQTAEIEARSQMQWLQGLGLLSLLLVSGLLVSVLFRTASERRRYREASEHDGLTGLYNHQSTLRLGHSLQQACRRELKPFTVIVADIDHFKHINDRYGHAAGDAVLRALGALLHQVFPKQAVIGRSGGEEFTVLIDSTVDQARFLVEDLRRRIQPVSIFDDSVDFSLSYGICEATESHAPLEDILRSADMALYQAKRSGRNRVVDAATLHSASAPESGLVVVGSGIQLGRHLSPRCLSEIQEAERVFVLTDGAAHAMLVEMRPDAIDLRVHYAVGKDRRVTYREMDAAIMADVRSGKRVCAVFYGHPGVFADVPHTIVRKAREAGYSARMEPGISSEACLYADLGIDPGRTGVQSLEATQFLLEDRQIDTRSLLLLWQVALTGDTSCTRFHAVPEELNKLVARLQLDYPADHDVILYEASRLSVEPFRAEHLKLADLASAHFEEYTTLVIPPCAPRHPDVAGRLLQTIGTISAPAR